MRVQYSVRQCWNVVSALFVAAPLWAQGPVREGATWYFLEGLARFDSFGRSLHAFEDLDDDGAVDFVATASAPEADFPDAGRVDIYSGADGTLLRRWYGTDEFRHIGNGVGAVPDIDGDGTRELAYQNRWGEVFVRSPVTDELFYRLARAVPGPLGRGLFLPTDDLDGDGVGEFVLSTTAHAFLEGSSPIHGRVALHSGATGEVLWTYRTSVRDSGEFAELGGVAAFVGDVSGDGVEDVLASVTNFGRDRFQLHLISGADGSRLQLTEAPFQGRWGLDFVALDDHDGDGIREIAVSASHRARDGIENVGWIGVYSLPHFDLRWETWGRQGATREFWGDNLGFQLGLGGDLDGDGHSDLLAPTARNRSSLWPHRRFGRLYAYSGLTGDVLMVWEADINLVGDQFWILNSSTSVFFQFQGIGDVTGDGHPDIIYSRPVHRGNGDNRGVVRVIQYRPDRPRFIRGDANFDGTFDLADCLRIVESLFEDEPMPCAAALDVNGGGLISITDAIFGIQYLFGVDPEREAPTPPFPECSRYDVVHEYIDLGCLDEGSCRE